MRIGYARVSTQDQNLDLQIDALEKAGCERIYKEKMTGKTTERPELKRLIDSLRKGDILVIYKLDRLGRTTKGIIELADQLEELGVELVSLRDNIDTTTAVGKAMFRMLAVLSEMERDLISERTKAGLESARARGRQGGRPKKATTKVIKAIQLYNTNQYTVNEIVELTGVSRATIYRKIKEQQG